MPNPGLLANLNELLGANTANNDADTTNVAANADGSIAERVEYIQTRVNLAQGGTPATYNPLLGFRVIVTEDMAAATGVNLFTVTGKCMITLWTIEVTNALGAAITDYQATLTTLNGVLIAAGNIASAAIGFMRTFTGDAGDTALSASTGAVSVTGVGDTNGKIGYMVVGKAGGSDIIKSVRTAGDSGDAMKHILFYWPLEAGASIVAI